MTPYCVDNDYFRGLAQAAAHHREEFRRELGLLQGRPVILYASKFERRKRAIDLVVAYKKLISEGFRRSKPYLLLIGDGEMRSQLEAETRLMRDDVRFLGFRNQSELPAFYDLCDVFVLPSEFEPWGLVINEVMNAGRAVIVSDHVGAGVDLVLNGKNGYVFPVADVNKLATALEQVLNTPETTTSMGRASAAIIADWNFERDLQGLREAVEDIMRRRRRDGANN
jgi:glycosyltransferase involved in cell wall biosynthesis